MINGENVLDTCLTIIEQKVICDSICALKKSHPWPYASARDGKVAYVSSVTSAKSCDVGHSLFHFLLNATLQKLSRQPSLEVSLLFAMVAYYETLSLTNTSLGTTILINIPPVRCYCQCTSLWLSRRCRSYRCLFLRYRPPHMHSRLMRIHR